MVRRLARGIDRVPAAVAAMALLSACRAGDALSRDAAAIDADAVPALVLVEERRIGSTEDPNYGFSSIAAVQVDEAGNVYVSEGQDREIRVYSASGELIRRIGRPGSGPGEFERWVGYFGISGDTVWAIDGNRIHLFDREGRVLSSAEAEWVVAPLHAEASTSEIVPVARRSDHLFISDRGPTNYSGGGSGATKDTVYIPRVRFSASGQVVDTVEVYPLPRSGRPTQLVDVGRSQFTLPQPPTAERLRINTVDGSLHIEPTDGGQFLVERQDLSGEPLVSRTFRYTPREFPDSVLDAAAARAARSGAANVGMMLMATESGVLRLEQHAADTASARRLIRTRMNWPQHQPPVLTTRLGADGAVWLRRETMEGGEMVRWLILGEDLLPVGALELPSRLRVVWSGGDRVWAAESDELGVPWLVGYRIQGD